MGDEDFIDAALTNEINSLIDQKLDRREQESKKREFDRTLDQNIPGWRETWHTPAFQEFLSRTEDDALLDNYTCVRAAFDRFDSNTVIKFFKLFDRKQKASASSGRHGQPSFAEVERARRHLAKLRDEKGKGLWRGREKEWVEKTNALIKTIQGE